MRIIIFLLFTTWSFYFFQVDLEEGVESFKVSEEQLASIVESLPAVINENLITKVIETIHQTVSRTRRTIGMATCLRVLLQPCVQTLDLSGLFFKMRLPGAINMTIRSIVLKQVESMKNLTVLNMVSKCSDEILHMVSQRCKGIVDVNVSISDLVTDAGLKALAVGCPKLEKLGIYKCWEVTTEGIEHVLRHSKNLQRLQSDQLGSVLINKFYKSDIEFKLTHFEQTQVSSCYDVRVTVVQVNIGYKLYMKRMSQKNINRNHRL